MAIDLRLILAGVGLLLLVIVLLKFGKVITRVLLVAGVLMIVILLVLALLSQIQMTNKVATVATVTSVGAAGASLGTLVLSVLLVVSLGTTGVFWVRWKLAKRIMPRREQRQLVQSEQLVEPDGVSLGDLDLSKWGW